MTPGNGDETRVLRVAPLAVAVVLIGMNLRGPITGVPPLLGDIREALGMSLPMAALVTTLPLLAFALLSPFVGPLAGRFGVNSTMLLSLVLLGAAIFLRPWFGLGTFLVTTALVGIFITVGNVLLPVVIRRDAPTRVAPLASASTAAFGIGQGVVAFTVVPIALLIGWRWSMALPGLLAILAVVAWIVVLRSAPDRSENLKVPLPTRKQFFHVFTLPDAWWVAAFFGMQSLLFYTTSTWMPDQLVDTAGLSQVAAGNALSIFHVSGIAGSLLVPGLLKVVGDARRVGLGLGLTWIVFYVGVYATPQGWGAWMILGGLIQGAAISLALILVAMRPVSADFGRSFSGMVQGVGYLIAAGGPLLIGWIFERVESWFVITIMLSALGLIMGIAGFGAGRERKIGA